MQTIFQSSFLQALGFAIFNSLWQIALVWLVCVLINNLLSLSASTKYRVAVAAELISFTWFIVTLQFYYHQYSQAWQQTATNTNIAQNIQAVNLTDNSFSSQLINWMVKGEQELPYLSLAYLVLMLILSVRWLLGYSKTQMIRHNGVEKIPVEWRAFAAKIAAQLGIKKEIRLYLSNLVTTPMTIGFLKPIILIPIASINHLSTAQLEAVILHELAHIKRYDYGVNIILSVIEISLFFNPFTQLLSRQIKKERENSCDDWVLQFQYNASVYAEALLRIAYLQTSPAFAMAATGRKNELLSRVKRIIDKKENRFNYRKQLLALMIVTGILSSIAWLSPLVTPYTLSKKSSIKITFAQKNRQSFAVEPMTVSINNPFFNPVFFLSTPLKAEIKKSLAAAQKEMQTGLPDTQKEMQPLIESIPPMVADALEMASHKIGNSNIDTEQELAKLDLAKNNLENTFRMDSSTVAKFFKGKLKDEISHSLKTMEKEMAKAKIEIDKSRKLNADIHIDQEKIQRDIKQAMEELKKIELGKLVSNALQIPAMLLEKDFQSENLKRKTRAVKDENEINIQKNIVPKPAALSNNEAEEPSLPTEHSADEMQATADIVNTILAQITASSNDERIVIDFSTAAKIKSFLMQLDNLKRKTKTIPVGFKEKKTAENKEPGDRRIVIQMR